MRVAGSPLMLAAVLVTNVVRAQDPAPEPAPKPPAYSLPWQLRPAVVANVVRSDTAVAFYEPDGADSGGRTIVTTLLFAYKITDEVAPLVRVGFVQNSPPEVSGVNAESGSAFMNPVVGVTYAPKLSANFKLAGFLGVAAPLGSGGGSDPEPKVSAALAAGVLARSAMDNAMFAVNYLTVFPGIDVAYVADGLTVQGEVTVLQLMRVRGNDTVEPDKSKTNLTSGVHVGYFLISMLSVGADLRYQRWLTTPKKPPVEAQDNLRDNLTVAIGPRFHFKLAETTWIRPGVAYARGLDDPMKKANYNIVQIDVPVSF